MVKYNAREKYHMMMVMVEQDRLMEHMWREVFALNNNHGRPGNKVATRLLMDLSSYESESLFLNFLQSRRGDSSKTGFARKAGRVGKWGHLPRGLSSDFSVNDYLTPLMFAYIFQDSCSAWPRLDSSQSRSLTCLD